MDDLQGVRVAGPLAPYAQGFAGELARLRYRIDPAQKQLRLAAQLSGWLADAGLDAADLDAATIGAYLTTRHAAGYGEFATPRALAPLLGYLRRLGVARPPKELMSRLVTDAAMARLHRPAAGRVHDKSRHPLTAAS